MRKVAGYMKSENGNQVGRLKAVVELSMAMSKPLREGINEFNTDYVQAKTANGKAIDAIEIAYEMAQSAIDI